MDSQAQQPPNLLGADRAALTQQLATWGQPPFRARQFLRWLHARGVTDYAAMTDLAKELRTHLARETTCTTPPVISDIHSRDGTRKFLFDVGGGAIEAVWIPERKRRTLCVSSQAGCALACTFCLTGKQGFAKNLASWQIVGQLHAINRMVGEAGRVTNVVFMGMGEPLLNLEQVVPALKLMTDPLAYGLSRRRVTISTVGVIPGIDRLRDLAPVALAVSLHAPDNALRDELVPLNRRYPLDNLIDACQRYLEKSPRDFITFEYALLAGINDADSQARDLARCLRRLHAKVNLIPFNPFPDAPYQAPTRTRILSFRDTLNDCGLVATIRRQRGNDILAACGQLAGSISGRVPTSGRIATPMVAT